MIISRTPYRISFLGGGTDYHPWYQSHGGAVLATSINHYCYITARDLPPFFNHHSRIVWSILEEVTSHQDIQHPAVRATLSYLGLDHGIEISHQGDLPARSGLGSSSAFTVGLLNVLYALRGEMTSKKELACEAVYVERDLLKENVGVQDQITTAFGGLNKVMIRQDGEFTVSPVTISHERSHTFQDKFLLFFTGISRTASDIAGTKMQAISTKQNDLRRMHEMVDDGVSILLNEHPLDDFGYLLNEAWQLKRGLAKNISPDFVDDIYTRAIKAGALGGKLLGAGGGGFMLFYVPNEQQAAVKHALEDLLWVPFQFENSGSQIIFYDPKPFSYSALHRRDFRHLETPIESLNAKMSVLSRERRNKLSLVE